MPLHVLVAQTSNDILASALVERLKQRDDVVLVSDVVLPTDGLRDWLASTGRLPDIFVLVGFGADLVTICAELLAVCQSSVVIRVVIAHKVAHLDWQAQSIDEVLSAARALYVERDRRKRRSTSIRIDLETALLQDTMTITDAAANDDANADNDGDANLFGQIERWLDSRLLAYVERATNSPGDAAALSLSRATVEALLTRGAVTSPGNTEAARTAADALRNHLDQAPNHRFAMLQRGLELGAIELQAFLLCLAPELANRYQRVFGFLSDELARRNPSLSLVSEIIGDPLGTRMTLAREGVLSRWHLWSGSSSLPHADEELRLDPVLVAWILGSDDALTEDPMIRDLVRTSPWVGSNWVSSPRDLEAVERVSALLRAPAPSPHWIVLTGRDGSLSRAVLERAAAATRTRLMRIVLGACRLEDAGNLLRVGWMARVLGAVPVLDIRNGDDAVVAIEIARRAIDMFADLPVPCVVIAADLADVVELLPEQDQAVIRLAQSTTATTLTALTEGAREHGLRLHRPDIERLAAAYPLPLDTLERALRLAGTSIDLANAVEEAQATTLAEALQTVASPQLPRLATRLAPSFKLEDVILPQDRRHQLDEIVSHVVYADQVLHDWGFGAQLPYGRGVAALFMGPSGCGKTMAARAIGHALRRWVFAVDLSRVVSKYVGETQKHLDAVFLEAEKAGAILLFDEAEALFSARGPVKDSHDRHANFETAYLLQRVEMFSGLAILTSNLGRNIDSAFLRRLRFIVEFPLPDAAAREKIWQQCLPASAPKAKNLDLRFLARRAELPGGSIRQITLRAAFNAAAEESSIEMRHILAATRAEAIKIGMPRLERELAELAA